jgi:nucleotide-binding universal stress UspA family protein
VYKRILVPVDGSDCSNMGLAEAIELAKEDGATLRLLHVLTEPVIHTIPPSANWYTGLIEAMRTTGKSLLAKTKATVCACGIEPETAMIEQLQGHVADAIVEEAGKWQADLIVMGTHGRRGLQRLALGSDAELVLRATPVPVLLVRKQDAK